MDLSGLSKPMARGVLDIPHLQIAHVEKTQKNGKNGEKTPKKVSDVLQSNTAILSHFNGERLDMTFTMLADKKGDIKRSLQLGRIWAFNYPASWACSNGGKAQPIKLDFAPVYAGFAHGLQDQAAMKALAAVHAAFGSATRETIPDDTRSAMNAMISRPIEASALLFRMALLWAACAATEQGGGALVLHTAADTQQPLKIANLGDYSVAFTRVATQGLQPIMLNVRGAFEASRYTRIARILALENPTFATSAGNAPPTCIGAWPRLPGAVAMFLSTTDQLGPLSGTISANEVAMVASYYARALGLDQQLGEWLQVATGLVYRPAGSAAMGRGKRCVIQVPQPRLAATLLMPMVQAVDTLDNEGILCGMDEPAQRLFEGACRAAVFLACFNNVVCAGGGDLLSRIDHSRGQRLRAHVSRFLAHGRLGSAATTVAVQLAAMAGWEEGFVQQWEWLSAPLATAMGEFYAVEAEECIPIIDAFPSTAAVLGLLNPCYLKTPPKQGVYYRVDTVDGRLGLGDGIYSLTEMQCHPRVFMAEIGQVGWPAPPQIYSTRLSYRGAPSDGQFNGAKLDGVEYTVLFQLEGHENVVKAMRTAQDRGSWHWTYEWHVPFSDMDATMQYINDGPDITLPFVAAPVRAPVTTVTVLAPHVPSEPAGPVGPASELRDHIGTAWGDIIDQHAAMAALAGREAEANRYDTNARALAGAVTGFDAGTASIIIDPQYHRSMWTHLHNIAIDAAQWTPSPGMTQDCLRVAAFARAQLVIDEAAPLPPNIETAPIDEAPVLAEVEQTAIELGNDSATAQPPRIGDAPPACMPSEVSVPVATTAVQMPVSEQTDRQITPTEEAGTSSGAAEPSTEPASAALQVSPAVFGETRDQPPQF